MWFKYILLTLTFAVLAMAHQHTPMVTVVAQSYNEPFTVPPTNTTLLIALNTTFSESESSQKQLNSFRLLCLLLSARTQFDHTG